MGAAVGMIQAQAQMGRPMVLGLAGLVRGPAGPWGAPVQWGGAAAP